MLLKQSRFSVYSWGVLAYNIAVILWGAFVRATGSGAGCGAHWPTCNGDIIPRAPQIETIIEFVHRISSGLTLLLVAILVVWAWRKFLRGSPVRFASGAALFFVLVEAALGAGLVLFGWTADDDSVGRAIMMMVHLVNTFLLLGNLALTAVWTTWCTPERFRVIARWEWILPVSLLGLLILGASGAITALGDTLFPAESLAEGMRAEFSGTAHFLLRLRVFHPLIAVLSGMLVYLAARNALSRVENPAAQRAAGLVIGLFVLQLVLGGINVILLAPVWLQLVHLLVSNLIWVVQVALTSFVIGRPNRAAGVANHPIHERIPGSAE